MADTKKSTKMLNVQKNEFNEFAKFKYRTLDDILDAIRASGQSVTMTDEIIVVGEAVVTDVDEHGFRTDTRKPVMFLMARAVDADTGLTADGWAQLGTHKGMSPEQETGCASTYARRYACCGLYGISAGNDTDPDSLPPPGYKTPKELQDDKEKELGDQQIDGKTAHNIKAELSFGDAEANEKWLCEKFGVATVGALSVAQLPAVMKKISTLKAKWDEKNAPPIPEKPTDDLFAADDSDPFPTGYSELGADGEEVAS